MVTCTESALMTKRTMRFIGAPFAEGQNLSGTEVAPNAMRDSGFQAMVEKLGWSWADDGDLVNDAVDSRTTRKFIEQYRKWMKVVQEGNPCSYSSFAAEKARPRDSIHVAPPARVLGKSPYLQVKNGQVIGDCLQKIHNAVYEASKNGEFCCTIGGDHSIAAGSISALLRTYPDLAVIWVDAHADANTPATSPSNHYHGMPAAHVMGWFEEPVPGFEWLKTQLPEDRLAYIGLRDIDDVEGAMLRNSGVHVYTMYEVMKYGIGQVIATALDKIDPEKKTPPSHQF